MNILDKQFAKKALSGFIDEQDGLWEYVSAYQDFTCQVKCPETGLYTVKAPSLASLMALLKSH